MLPGITVGLVAGDGACPLEKLQRLTVLLRIGM